MQIGMEWDSGHANRNGMGQQKEVWNGCAEVSHCPIPDIFAASMY